MWKNPWQPLQLALTVLAQDRRQRTECMVLLCRVQPAHARSLANNGPNDSESNGFVAIQRETDALIECENGASALVLYGLNPAQSEVVAARVLAFWAERGRSARVTVAQRVPGEPVHRWLRRLGVPAWGWLPEQVAWLWGLV